MAAENAAMSSLGDKILEKAIAADAAVVILKKKLSMLLECKLIMICNSLKHQIEDIIKSLEPVYDFLAKYPKPTDRKEWKSQVLEAVYKTEDGIDIFRGRIALQDSENVNTFSILWAKFRLWRCLEEFVHRMTTLKREEHIPDKPQGSGSDKERPPSIYDPREWVDLLTSDISGEVKAARESSVNELNVNIGLKDGKDKIRVIVGERGLGKTFLARKIFIQHRGNFDCCAWVNVSSMAKPEDALQSLLNQALNRSSSKPHLHQQLSVLQDTCYKELYKKRYLIVLDDVCGFSLLWAVVTSLPDSKSGSCLLITTQDKSIGFLDRDGCIDLQGLVEEESMELMERKLRIGGRHIDQIMKSEDCKKDFIIKCRGSPLRLNLLGGLLAESTNTEEIINTIPDTDDLDELFAYCYNKMRGELKPCFLYMTLFPKSDSIPVRRLLRLWLSEGLLVTTEGAQMEPEDLGWDYLKQLIFRNLVEAVETKENGSPRRVRVVTCLYDLFHSGAIGTELLYVNTKETEEGQPPEDKHHEGASRLRWLAERSNIKELSSSPAAKIHHLRTFLSFNWREGMLTKDIGNFLKIAVSGKHYNLLTVLDLEGVYKPNLDKVLGKLVLLRHLGLRSTALGSLPKSVADLPYLETLDLKFTNITELPKLFWTKSRNLRHLYLNGCCRIDRNTFSSSCATGTKPFANLHTLSGAVVDTICMKNAAGVAKHTIVGLSNMKKLTKLGVMFQYHEEHQNAIGDWISGLTNLQSLTLGIIESSKASELPQQLSLVQHFSVSKLYLVGKFNPSSKNLIPQNLITLTLSGSKMNMDHIFQLGDLPNLKALNLKADSFTGRILTLSEGRLQNLQVLRLWKLQDIETLELKNKMPKIKMIEFKSCPQMKEIKHIRKVGAEQKIKSVVVLELMQMKAAFVDEISMCVKDPKIIVKENGRVIQEGGDRVCKRLFQIKENMKRLLPEIE